MSVTSVHLSEQTKPISSHKLLYGCEIVLTSRGQTTGVTEEEEEAHLNDSDGLYSNLETSKIHHVVEML